ncbi:hypothetical protein AB0M79_26125 [Polymorphospora sp. NPDC051019]|uniref:SCO7613 C-terminal domain-containing membrane protein n=1 Tax=Polymorphospora sp. NPDC051019 TaxID=3155725 RepID=UPI003448A815
MTEPAPVYPCPACGGTANLAVGCRRCGRAPDPVAAEVIRLDYQIRVLAPQVEQARQHHLSLAAALRDAQQRRQALAARVRAATLAARPATRPAPVLPPGTVAPRPGAPVPAGIGTPDAPTGPVGHGAAGGAAGWPAAPGYGVPGGPAVPARPEASTRTVQNILFILGGLLFGTAAIVFTSVAWATYGVAGRAAILAVVTGLALAVPPLARWRGLTATAETFATIGLLLVLLDGYAAWYVDLFGLAGSAGTRYTGLVCAVTALVAAGYAALTRLWAPRYVALLVAQPVLPLLAYDHRPDPLGWALVYAAVAAGNLLVLRLARHAVVPGAGPVPANAAPGGGRRVAFRVVGWVGYAVMLAAATISSLIALVVADVAGPVAVVGLPLVATALLLVAAGAVAGSAVLRGLAGAVLVVVLAVAALRPVAEVRPSLLLVAAAVVALGLAAVVTVTARPLPAAVRTGHRVGALLVTGVTALVTVIATAVVAVATMATALPGDDTRVPFDWQVPVAVLVVTGALGVLLPRAGRDATAAVGAGLAVLALPAAVPMAGWPVAAVDLAAMAALLFAALWHRAVVGGVVRAGTGAVLTLHAVGVGLARPSTATGTLAVVLLLGLAVAAVADRLAAGPGGGRPAGPGAADGADAAGPHPGAVAGPAGGANVTGLPGRPAHRRPIGGLAFAAALVTWPALVVAGLAAATIAGWWQARAALLAVALLLPVPVLVRRLRPALLPYATAAVAVAVVATATAAGGGPYDEPPAVYAAVGILLLVTTALLVAWTPGRILAAAATLPLLAIAVVTVVPAVVGVLLAPYAWLGAIWSGRPSGGVPTPSRRWLVESGLDSAAPALALGVLTVAIWLAAHLLRPATAGPATAGPATAGPATAGPATAGPATAGPAIGKPAAVEPATAGRGIGWWQVRVRLATTAALPVGVAAVLVALTVAGTPWPVVPAVSLAAGLAYLLTAALVPVRTGAVLVAVPVGVALTGAGLAGALPTEASTIAALGLVVAGAATVGVAGRGRGGRIAGWLVAVVAGLTLAATVALAADLPLRLVALAVLGGAAVALATGTVLRIRRPAESVAVEALAHAGALVALLLSLGGIRYVAAVFTLWGVAVGVRALWAGPVPGAAFLHRRRVLVWAALGSELVAWWLLLVADRVAVLEAYSLPAAALALLAGWLAARSGLGSWSAYGPGLAAGLLPSLASVLVGDDQPMRRLLLGTGAVLVVLAGGAARRQAPVVLGGATVVLLALHELVAVWDLLPRWIFLAIGGLALIALAVTYERRRRDLARLRAAVGRMT